MLRHARNLPVRQRTMLVNALRAHMAELVITAAQGLARVEELAAGIDHQRSPPPELVRSIRHTVVAQLRDTMARTREIELQLAKWHWQSKVGQLLATIPGAGIMGASAIAATVTDPTLFRSGREVAAWQGMTPKLNSSGGKEWLAFKITKRIDQGLIDKQASDVLSFPVRRRLPISFSQHCVLISSPLLG